jgi:hypothetical protein
MQRAKGYLLCCQATAVEFEKSKQRLFAPLHSLAARPRRSRPHWTCELYHNYTKEYTWKPV